MKKLFAASKFSIEFVLIVLMFLLSIFTFNNIFGVTKDGDYFREVIAALIGTLLTVVITFVLFKHQLKHQQENEEVKERNIEVFKKRVARYEQVTQLLIDVLEDGVDEEEAKTLKNAIYNLALLSSVETIETISRFLRSHVLEDEQKTVGLFEVVACFRKDLKLGDIDKFSTDALEAVESLLAVGFNQKKVFGNLQTLVKRLRIKLRAELQSEMEPDAFSIYVFEKMEGSSDEIYFRVQSDESLWEYWIGIRYPKSKDIEKIEIRVTAMSILDLNEMQKKKGRFKEEFGHAHQVATERGFKFTDNNEDREIVPNYFKEYSLAFEKLESGELSVADSEVHKLIAEDFLAIEGFVDPDTSSEENTTNNLPLLEP